LGKEEEKRQRDFGTTDYTDYLKQEMITGRGEISMAGRKDAALQNGLFLIRVIRVIRGFRRFAVIRENPCESVVKKQAAVIHGSQGFTLIEVLIAMAIIGVGLVALVTLFPLGLRSSRLAGDFTTASFIGQQALDNIRASAQVYDPGDKYFDNTTPPDRLTTPPPPRLVYSSNNTNHNGLGYYELPVSAVKGYLSPIRFPREPAQPQWWEIWFDPLLSPPNYRVTNSISGDVGTGTVGSLFSSNDDSIAFILYDNEDGDDYTGVYDVIMDEDYDEFDEGDKLRINVEMRGGAPYYWYAMRAPVTEDRDLDGILDGRLPDGSERPAPHNQIQEDTGLDLVPDFWDRNNNDAYDPGIDAVGEAGFVGTNDPHGDNRYRYTALASQPPRWAVSDPPVESDIINPGGTEGNWQIDAQPDDYIQKVTVTVGWREGGQDRFATFSASIANQFR